MKLKELKTLIKEDYKLSSTELHCDIDNCNDYQAHLVNFTKLMDCVFASKRVKLCNLHYNKIAKLYKDNL